MRYEFTKMQSLGNDFIVLDGVSNEINITAEIARRLADRNFGIGCDQILVVQAADNDAVPAAQFMFKIFNQDGSEVGQCGNGARCLARFLVEQGLTNDKTIVVHTANQSLTLCLHCDDSVTVEMGIPEFSPHKIPFIEVAGGALEAASVAAPTYLLDVDGMPVEISALAIGNPHAVHRVGNVADTAVDEIGKKIANHQRFPAKANVGFMQVVTPEHIRLRVYERGVGETLGCGSGACAAVASGIMQKVLNNKVKVSLPGGDAEVHWRGPNQSIFLTGPAHTVFHGSIDW